tara:strand:- start:65032 stop:65742 length:711 start_codon:yes stop_codon:yes gene_type:complete
MRINISSYQNIVILTGAGISVASGLPTYRGDGGLWNDRSLSEVVSAKGLREKPSEVWSFSMGLRQKALAAEPNAAHLALAEAEQRASGAFTLITQNVDGLHQRAGSCNVLELHGSVHRIRCTRCKAPSIEARGAPESPTKCVDCGAPVRPDVVLFDELLPPSPEHLAKRALRDCDLFIAIGTSGNVFPAANFVRSARYARAETILINLGVEQQESSFDKVYRERAEAFLPSFLGVA